MLFRSPKLRVEFETVLDRLGKQPAKFRFTSPPNLKDPVEVTLSREMFGDFLRRILYTVPGISMMPMAIHAAYNGDFEPFARLCYELSIRTQDEIPFGMYYSILCNESFPFIPDAESAAIAKGTYIGDYRVRAQRAACAGWPDARVPRSFVEPVRSDRPVLLFSGEIDPAAQPEYAAEAAKYLPHSKHVVARNGSHGLGGPCPMGIVARFLENASVDGLDTSCVEQMKLPAFRLRDPKNSGMTAKDLADYTGTYEAAPGIQYIFRTENGVMLVKFPAAPGEVAFYPSAPNRVAMMIGDGEVEFVRNESGAVTGLVVHTGGREIRMTRK